MCSQVISFHWKYVFQLPITTDKRSRKRDVSAFSPVPPFFTMSLTMSTAVSLIAVILGTVDCLRPELRVNPTVISVRQSVRLSCEPPQGLHGAQNKCTFMTNTRGVSEDSDCEVSFTGAELIRLGNDGPESEILIYCVYIPDTGGPSLHSVPVKVTVTGLEPQLRVNPTVISVRQSIRLSCEPPQGLHEPQTKCTFLTHEYSLIKDSDCNVSFTGAELIRLRGFKPESEILISCVYTLDTGDPSLLSAAVKVTVTEKEPMPHPPPDKPPSEPELDLFLWRHILSALIILLALVFTVEHVLFTRSPSGSQGAGA
ncbi:uncharacterized protein LOC108931829 isoform X1 [Scleropages formosus]|uniref:uncharacterized protein LOC108931829 isoform X1 n=1 Tax=Scleropages formosus TaxID=113540 RepID=UPI0010FA9C00|nr:uncharacterized protein LOC108931829 isoform X1 [Scleropages formosus]